MLGGACRWPLVDACRAIRQESAWTPANIDVSIYGIHPGGLSFDFVFFASDSVCGCVCLCGLLKDQSSARKSFYRLNFNSGFAK